jgi:hypothetical protein
MNTKTLKLDKKILKNTFVSAIILAGLLFATYIYFVGNTTFSLVESKNTEQDIKEVKSDIAVLEQEYMKTLEVFTKTFALEQGFEEMSESDFASRKVFVTMNQ